MWLQLMQNKRAGTEFCLELVTVLGSWYLLQGWAAHCMLGNLPWLNLQIQFWDMFKLIINFLYFFKKQKVIFTQNQFIIKKNIGGHLLARSTLNCGSNISWDKRRQTAHHATNQSRGVCCKSEEEILVVYGNADPGQVAGNLSDREGGRKHMPEQRKHELAYSFGCSWQLQNRS